MDHVLAGHEVIVGVGPVQIERRHVELLGDNSSEILGDLALDNIPIVTVLNKADLLTAEQREELSEHYPYRFLSATDSDSVNRFREYLDSRLYPEEAAQKEPQYTE